MIHAKLDEVDRNQKDLAEAVDIDAGTLSRYFAGETEARYEKLRAMYEVLREWEEQHRQPATKLMTEGFTSTTLEKTRREAADKMLDGDFSQLPVRETEDGAVVGMVTDTDLMRIHDDEKSIKEMESDDELHHVIEVARDTDRQLIEKILEEGHPAVVVVDGGTPEGIITKADLLESVSSPS
jgi:predicted transcriptional regulator